MTKCRLYAVIDERGISIKEALIASEELDKEILEEMLKDPKVENIYLKQVIKAKECEVKNKDNEIATLKRRILELSELAQMMYEVGISARKAIRNVQRMAEKENLKQV